MNISKTRWSYEKDIKKGLITFSQSLQIDICLKETLKLLKIL